MPGRCSAYYFLVIEELIRAGASLGLSPEDAKVLTLQTAFGAATMGAKGDATAALIAGVTSPKRTTHAAIISMPENGFGDVIVKRITACRDRAVELGRDGNSHLMMVGPGRKAAWAEVDRRLKILT